MTGYPYRTQFGWIATLALAWLALSSPWSTAWNLLIAGVTVTLAIAAIALATRRQRARRRAAQAVLSAIDASLETLPGDIRRNTPLVLTAGMTRDVQSSVFGNALVKITDAAIWVRVDDPSRLPHIADALKRWRNGQGPDAVACLVAADAARDASTLTVSLRNWRASVGAASRALGYSLPVCVAVYAEEANGPPDDSPWFGFSGDVPVDGGIAQTLAIRLSQYAGISVPADRPRRMHRAARLDALVRWADTVLMPTLRHDDPHRANASRPLPLAAFGVTAIAGAPAPDADYARYIASITGLTPATREGRRPPYTLPDPLLRGLALQPVQRVLPHALAHGFVWLTLAFCAAAAASAWHNQELVARVTGDMARFQALDPANDAARRDALLALKRDRDELERYQRNGVPPRLGLGFYRGKALREPVDGLIASYQPPEPPPPTVELDSLSLFRSGSAVLEPGSNRVLIAALDMIKAHPDKRVLVAGHTDSTGHAATNLKLSEARATSVRDWLADAAGLPVTHFAIQGYGDTRPKASNTTDAGRAVNRRVEITLVPDCRDTGRGAQATSGHPACSFQ